MTTPGYSADSGKTIVTRVPLPASLATLNPPAWWYATNFAMVSPVPLCPHVE